MKGKVYLVGAGPGDPELLTVKALRLLRSADAVLYDDLVSSEIVELIPPAVQRQNVGKRCGHKTMRQEEINFLLVTLASSGLQVVRLKSGDPLIFGRAGEEIEALRKAEIPYEIVSGITSALAAAAAAGIPLTHRKSSSTVVLTTGHRAEDSDAEWSRFAESQSTLIVYMPGHDYAQLAVRLEAAGFAKETPCAVISKATTPQQQAHLTIISHLHRTPNLPAPTLLVVGEVISFAGQPAVQSSAGFAGLEREFASVLAQTTLSLERHRQEESIA
jgi:uroporphyrin-III C-methyltransferase